MKAYVGNTINFNSRKVVIKGILLRREKGFNKLDAIQTVDDYMFNEDRKDNIEYTDLLDELCMFPPRCLLIETF